MKGFFNRFVKNIILIVIGALIIETVYCVGLSTFTYCKDKNPVETNIFETAAIEAPSILNYEKKVPKFVRDAVSEEGWEFTTADTFTASFFTQIAYGSDVAGHADVMNKLIVMDTDAYKNESQPDDYFTVIFLHEYGHVVDDTFGILSQSREFLDIYKKHCNGEPLYYTDYTLNQPAEFFADSFMFYTIDRNKFNEDYPDVVEYFDNFYKSQADAEFSAVSYIARNSINTAYRMKAFIPMIVVYIIGSSLFIAWVVGRKIKKSQKTF